MVNGIIDSSQKIVTSGLVLNYDPAQLRSYPTTGTNLTDLSGNNYTGVLTNGASFDTGNGGSIFFDGINDFIELGDVLDMGTNSYTICQWLNFNLLIATNNTLSKNFASIGNYRFSVGCRLVPPKLTAFMQGNGGSDVYPVGSTTINTNTWFMATFVFNRASSIQIYYNETLETLTNSAVISQWSGLNFQSNIPLRVGCATASNNTGVVNPTNGKIASTLVYNRVLSATEVSQNYNANKSRYGL